MVTTNSFQSLVDNVSSLAVDVLKKEEMLSVETDQLILRAIVLLKPIAKYLQVEVSAAEFMGNRIDVRGRGIFLGALYIDNDTKNAALLMDITGQIYSPQMPNSKEPALLRYLFQFQQSEERLAAIVDCIHACLAEAKEKLEKRLENLTKREEKLKAVKDFLQS